MNVGICVIAVILAALTSSCLSLPSQSARAEGSVLVPDGLHPSRRVRSAPAPPSGHFSFNQEDEASSSLSELLARLISRKGSPGSPGSPYQSRSFLSSRASGLSPSHRIKDRDYIGWMDFGRRSAEEYEYSS